MTTKEAVDCLKEYLESYKRGSWTLTEAEIRIYEFAVYIEPGELVSMLPDSLREKLAQLSLQPLLRPDDWSIIEAVCVRPEKIESYKLEKRKREDRQYEGICKLHKYFSEHGNPLA